jgi:hypothetical protein
MQNSQSANGTITLIFPPRSLRSLRPREMQLHIRKRSLEIKRMTHNPKLKPPKRFSFSPSRLCKTITCEVIGRMNSALQKNPANYHKGDNII